jgi:hypothetical protein
MTEEIHMNIEVGKVTQETKGLRPGLEAVPPTGGPIG